MSTAASHIAIENLNVRYHERHVLKNVSLTIPDNRITVIMGPSGCGKTTLLKCLNRLIDLQDGAQVTGGILVDGTDVLDPRCDVIALRKKMVLLFQRPQVLPMSIFDNVAYGPRIHGLRDRAALHARVEKCLREAALWEEVRDRLHSPASRLSIGQQQRLCLAAGLAVEPEVILGDEPTSALDPLSAECVERRLLELRERYTLVLVTHILRQARRLADYVVFLYLGEVVEHGPAEEIFSHPVHPLTKAYIHGTFMEPGIS